MYFALIKAGVVKNVIVAEADAIAAVADSVNPGGSVVDVTNVTPRPSAGWTYNGAKFTPGQSPAAP